MKTEEVTDFGEKIFDFAIIHPSLLEEKTHLT